jgi:hypothetical protein
MPNFELWHSSQMSDMYTEFKCLLLIIIIVIIIFQLHIAAFKAYCVIWVRRSNFHYQVSPRISPRKSTYRRKVELWARNVR